MDMEHPLFASVDMILFELSNKGVNEAQLSLVRDGKLSPFGALGYHMEDDNDAILFRRMLSEAVSDQKYSEQFRRHKKVPYFGCSDLWANLHFLCIHMMESFRRQLNNADLPYSYYQGYYSFSRSMSICTFKYGADNWHRNLNSSYDTLVFCKTPQNSVYLRVYYDSICNRNNNDLFYGSNDYVLVRVPFRELGSKKCFINRIVGSLPRGMTLKDVLDVRIWDVIGDEEHLCRKNIKNLSFCAGNKNDLEHLSSFIPDNSLILQGKEIIQLLKIYLLSLVCEFDLEYQNRLHICLNKLCDCSDYYPRKIPMTHRSRLALRGILNYLDNSSNIKFERNHEFFNRGIKGQEVLHSLDRYNCYNYLNGILYSPNICPMNQSFDKVFLMWIYKNILNVPKSLHCLSR